MNRRDFFKFLPIGAIAASKLKFKATTPKIAADPMKPTPPIFIGQIPRKEDIYDENGFVVARVYYT